MSSFRPRMIDAYSLTFKVPSTVTFHSSQSFADGPTVVSSTQSAAVHSHCTNRRSIKIHVVMPSTMTPAASRTPLRAQAILSEAAASSLRKTPVGRGAHRCAEKLHDGQEWASWNIPAPSTNLSHATRRPFVRFRTNSNASKSSSDVSSSDDTVS